MKKILFVCLVVLIPCLSFAQTSRVKIFMSNSQMAPESEDCGKVYAVSRTIPQTKSIATAALQELFKGVADDESDKKYESLFSAQSANILVKLTIANGSAYVNFHHRIKTSVSSASTSCGRDMFFAQVENTLKQFQSIKKVFFAIDGKPSEFYEWMEIGSCPKELGKCSSKNFR